MANEEYDLWDKNARIKKIVIIDDPEDSHYAGEQNSYCIKIVTNKGDMDICGCYDAGPHVYVEGEQIFD